MLTPEKMLRLNGLTMKPFNFLAHTAGYRRVGDRRDRHLLLEQLLRLFVQRGALVAVGDEPWPL